ncbi:methylglutaconyl-CoA hydratase, mitochondrial [Cloeon dipterum]|uniref:methylglutaconyl-CoA hydratase, mitochondrial n=1 Tax=Cloeon dipterum TaxID=197152 RepID=UPI0032207F0F
MLASAATKQLVQLCRPASGVLLQRWFAQQASDSVVISRLQDKHNGIAVLGMNRPEAKNAFGKAFVQQFTDAVKIVKHDQSIRILIVRSLVPGVFCAGADLKERATMTDREVVEFVNRLRKLTTSVEKLPMPTIAAVDGAALGGGLELALGCDLRVVASNAKLGLVESRLAIIPGAGGTQRLPRIVGGPLAKELLFTGRIFDGKKAREYGIANHAPEQNDAKDAAFLRAMQLAEEILPSGPIALNLIKTAVDAGLQTSIDQGYKIEEQCYAHVVPTRDRIEGLLAFKEKRAPRFTGE